jgi:hypothetical protein
MVERNSIIDPINIFSDWIFVSLRYAVVYIATRKKRNDMTSRDNKPSGVTEKYSGRNDTGLLTHSVTENKRWILPVTTNIVRPDSFGRKNAIMPKRNGARMTNSTMKNRLFL